LFWLWFLFHVRVLGPTEGRYSLGCTLEESAVWRFQEPKIARGFLAAEVSTLALDERDVGWHFWSGKFGLEFSITESFLWVVMDGE
jgi:hypothetical protein